MNLELLEAFHQNYPEAADGYLERIKKDDGSKDAGCATYAITLQFNRVGSLLAIGCNDGRIEIWDHVTRRISKVLVAHAHPVCSLSWSRDSKKLLSASTDNTVSIWNVLSSACEQTFQFPCPVMKVQFNARKPDQLLVCPMRHAPVVISVPSGAPTIIQPEDENDLSIVASYDRRGRYIYTGNSKGKVCIYETKDFQLISSFKSTSAANAAIKSIEFARRGEYFLLNCADRVIRVYNCEDALNANVTDPEPIKKLKDLVTGECTNDGHLVEMKNNNPSCVDSYCKQDREIQGVRIPNKYLSSCYHQGKEKYGIVYSQGTGLAPNQLLIIVADSSRKRIDECTHVRGELVDTHPSTGSASITNLSLHYDDFRSLLIDFLLITPNDTSHRLSE
ncbi:unnamed protein product [Schistosoma bovis]|nr:unnamed protein product [Schistosoma bovis]